MYENLSFGCQIKIFISKINLFSKLMDKNFIFLAEKIKLLMNLTGF
jgi:hypothetical protein